jgi:hypothetical protein
MHVYDGCMTYDHADWKWNDWWTYYDSWMTDEHTMTVVWQMRNTDEKWSDW